jgi:hypothetical protein
MRLVINRDQAKGLLGGVKFELSARVELSSQEAELVKRYKAEKEVLLEREIPIPFTGRAIKLNITIGSLATGQTFKCGDIAEIVEIENNVKQSCESFKRYLVIMSNFGGQEVVEY